MLTIKLLNILLLLNGKKGVQVDIALLYNRGGK